MWRTRPNHSLIVCGHRTAFCPDATVSMVTGLSEGTGTGGRPRGAAIGMAAPIGLSFWRPHESKVRAIPSAQAVFIKILERCIITVLP